MLATTLDHFLSDHPEPWRSPRASGRNGLRQKRVFADRFCQYNFYYKNVTFIAPDGFPYFPLILAAGPFSWLYLRFHGCCMGCNRVSQSDCRSQIIFAGSSRLAEVRNLRDRVPRCQHDVHLRSGGQDRALAAAGPRAYRGNLEAVDLLQSGRMALHGRKL